MMTVKQVSALTGVSVRTLQFYDEIGLFKPTTVTDAGYRLYDENALEILQQILFFKELDFTLKEIKTIMENPQFDKTEAFAKQRELILIKRDRLNNLLKLLDKLVKGEKCMDFKDFDMSGYFRILADFKTTHRDKIIKQLGNMENFDDMISDLKSREDEIAEMAINQYGSLENYTKAMKKSLADFLDNGPSVDPSEVNSLLDRSNALTRKLTADLTKDVSSPEIREITGELITYVNECSRGMDMGENYWPNMADLYISSPAYIQATDKQYGEGASKYIGFAIKAYLDFQ
ncbi:MerR family transcriptional regulator [Clostridium sp. MCC353]|uniref:MerR family transcriptional regulator n=1 Tax=Clostridium sp. MCC353 TaxID=2592646 RepID=UPI001C018D9A|nr:MerR family transcriptional regulator [Clostridium sp. MCC353]MBT9776096.1 MerR family transcriptional regulator [Clostridium sp. MCC353]